MRLVFLGTPEAAVTVLDALHEAGHEIGLVVTRPDRPVGRSRRPAPPPVKVAAARWGLPVAQPTRVRDAAFLEVLAAARPDALVVVAYGRILPAPVLDLPRLGPVNLHFSVLPAYRGAAPVQWALARGETRTGVTTMRMSEGLDEGDVLLRREVGIEPGEHAPGLTARLAVVGAALLVETLTVLESGTVHPTPQDAARATFAPPLKREDGLVDASMTAREVEGRVRGFDPWPGAWLGLRGRRLRVVRAAALDPASATAPFGTVLELSREALVLACAHGTRLRVEAVQFDGGRPIPIDAARNGRLLDANDRFEPLRRE